MLSVKMIVCDMAGTTVRDNREVETVFLKAIRHTGLQVEQGEVNAMMGWSKVKVFQTLWNKQVGKSHPQFDEKVAHSYQVFTQLLEEHYATQPVQPTEGAIELFHYCREQQIKIALTTGFYRKVTDIILGKLGWLEGLNNEYVATSENAIIDCSVSSSDVQEGRPAPDMIQLAMKKLHIEDPATVINIGDTPSDLQSATSAGVRLSLGVANGTHTTEELQQLPNDGILPTVGHLINLLQGTRKMSPQ
jgi:phosphonatase-like hydrolase